MENENINTSEESSNTVVEEKSDVQVISEFESLDISKRTETDIYTIDFIEELCTDAFEYRTIEEHNLCANFSTNNIHIANQFSFTIYANLILGLIVGYIAIRGLFDPWRN